MCPDCGTSLSVSKSPSSNPILTVTLKRVDHELDPDGITGAVGFVSIPFAMWPLWKNLEPELHDHYWVQDGFFPLKVDLIVLEDQIQSWFDLRLSYPQMLRELGRVRLKNKNPPENTKDFLAKKHGVKQWGR